MTQEDTYYIIGIDGGASKTRGILFTQSGDTITTAFEKGSNLAIFGETAANRLHKVINALCNNANIPLDLVDAIGLGLAGASDKDGRDLVFKMLDGLKLSQRALIANDAEAAYEVNCPGDFGILVTVGTGVICLSRNENGETVRTAGKGHEQGDMGSGYWIGKQALLNLSLNETSVIGDSELEEIMEAFLVYVEEDHFQTALENVYENTDSVSIIAGFAESVILLAENGNEVMLSVLQEAAHAVAGYITALAEELKYNENHIVLAGNGSVIQNELFRKSLNDDLRFDFPEIKWTFSTISPAYGAGMLAAKVQGVDVKVSNILKGDTLAAA